MLLVVVGLFFGERDLGRLDGFLTAVSVTIALTGLSAAFLVYAHAASSRNRAYLALASTFLAVGWTAVAMLLVTPGALAAGEQVLGDPQSAPWTSVFLHAVLPVGVGITATILRFMIVVFLSRNYAIPYHKILAKNREMTRIISPTP